MFIDDYRAYLRACQKENDCPGMTKILMAFCESPSRQLLPKNKTTEELVVAFLEGAVLDKELLCDYFGMSDHKARYFALSMVRHFGDFRDLSRKKGMKILHENGVTTIADGLVS